MNIKNDVKYCIDHVFWKESSVFKINRIKKLFLSMIIFPTTFIFLLYPFGNNQTYEKLLIKSVMDGVKTVGDKFNLSTDYLTSAMYIYLYSAIIYFCILILYIQFMEITRFLNGIKKVSPLFILLIIVFCNKPNVYINEFYCYLTNSCKYLTQFRINYIADIILYGIICLVSMFLITPLVHWINGEKIKSKSRFTIYTLMIFIFGIIIFTLLSLKNNILWILGNVLIFLEILFIIFCDLPVEYWLNLLITVLGIVAVAVGGLTSERQLLVIYIYICLIISLYYTQWFLKLVYSFNDVLKKDSTLKKEIINLIKGGGIAGLIVGFVLMVLKVIL